MGGLHGTEWSLLDSLVREAGPAVTDVLRDLSEHARPIIVSGDASDCFRDSHMSGR